MRSIVGLFKRSPFPTLESHMAKVFLCASTLKKIVNEIETLKKEQLKALVDELLSKEHESDVIKNDIRNDLDLKHTRYQIDPVYLLDILTMQDNIADRMEAIGQIFLLKPLTPFDNACKNYISFFEKSLNVFYKVHSIITTELEKLLDSAGGRSSIEMIIREVVLLEMEAKNEKALFKQQLFSLGDSLSPPAFQHWLMLIEETAAIATLSKKLANRIKMIL